MQLIQHFNLGQERGETRPLLLKVQLKIKYQKCQFYLCGAFRAFRLVNLALNLVSQASGGRPDAPVIFCHLYVIIHSGWQLSLRPDQVL